MTEPERFDVLVVAGGKGGKTLAMDLAKAGRRAAMVERVPEMIGGLESAVLRDGVLAHPTMAEGLNQLFASSTE